MRGLKTVENSKFLRYWKLVDAKAKELGKVFYAECGEGHLLEADDIECEDMRGWLIPVDQSEEFEAEWRTDNVSDKWIDNIYWAEWSNDRGTIEIQFNTY
jgi:hypothetical protein